MNSRNSGRSFLRDQIYDQVKADIVTGLLPPSTELQEQDLAERFDVSKTPVREALGRLVHEGLVEVYPRIGYQVRLHTIEDISDLFDFRAVLEGAAAEAAAQRITPTELAQLEQLVVIPVDPADRESVLDYLEKNRRFHLIVAQAANNGYLLRHIDQALSEVTAITHFRLHEARDLTDRTCDEHRVVVDALAAGDGQKARAAAESTIYETRDEVIAALLATRNLTDLKR